MEQLPGPVISLLNRLFHRLPIALPVVSSGEMSGLGTPKTLADRRKVIPLDVKLIRHDTYPWVLTGAKLNVHQLGCVGRWVAPVGLPNGVSEHRLDFELATLVSRREVNPESDGRGNRHHLLAEEVAAGIVNVELQFQTRGLFRGVINLGIQVKLQGDLQSLGDPVQIYAERVVNAYQGKRFLDVSSAKRVRWSGQPHKGMFFEIDVTPRTPTAVIEGWRKWEHSRIQALRKQYKPT